MRGAGARTGGTPETVVPGRRRRRESSRPPLPAGTHKLTVVAVSPEGLKSAPRDWTIEVKPKETRTALAESEVGDWLALYRRARETKDVDLLTAVGRGHTRPRPQQRGTLAGYDVFRVEVKDLTIRIDAVSASHHPARGHDQCGTVPHSGLTEGLLIGSGRLDDNGARDPCRPTPRQPDDAKVVVEQRGGTPLRANGNISQTRGA